MAQADDTQVTIASLHSNDTHLIHQGQNDIETENLGKMSRHLRDGSEESVGWQIR